MIVRRAVWHTLEPTAQVVPTGWNNPQILRDITGELRPGEMVTVLEPERDDALAILSAHFQLSIVEE